MKVVYIGTHPEVVIDEYSQDATIVKGQPVELPDALAAKLLDQDTWQDATPSAAPVVPEVQTPEAPAPVENEAAAADAQEGN